MKHCGIVHSSSSSGVAMRSVRLRARDPRSVALSRAAGTRFDTCSRSSRLQTLNAAGLSVETDNLPHSRIELKVTVPKERCVEAYNKTVLQLKEAEENRAGSFPGFRKGAKVPNSIVVQTYGLDTVKASLFENVIVPAMQEAMEPINNRLIQDSEKIETDIKEIISVFDGPSGKPTDDAYFVVGVDVFPEISWVSPYKDISVSVEEPGNAVTDAAEVEKEFKKLCKNVATLRVVQGRGLEKGDVAIMNIKAFRVNEDNSSGDEILAIRNPTWKFDTEDGADFLPGVLDGLLGMSTNEEREFDCCFPEDWSQDNLAGKTGRFHATVNELFYQDYPELNDSIAGELLEGCTTIEEVRAKLLEAQQKATSAKTANGIHNALTEALAEIIVVDPPYAMIAEQGRQMYQSRLFGLITKGEIDETSLEQLASPQMSERFIESNVETITKQLRMQLACDEVLRLENITVPPERLSAEVEQAKSEFEEGEHEYDLERLEEQAEESLKGEMVIQWLKETVAVELKPFEDEPSSTDSDQDQPKVFTF